tara:strand:+ start:312 stop:1565 length:1254 start_codon:yes stop_codon:yes gene_type:complete
MKHDDNCINEFDSSALDEDKALSKIIKSIKPIKKTERISIKDSYDRILAENIKAKINLPSFNNSAMDGYAVNIKNLIKNNYVLNECSVSLAGRAFHGKLEDGKTVRVMTGAVIPNNADAVVMKEMVNIKKEIITFNKNIKKNQNIRFIGEDVKKNTVIFKKYNQLSHPRVAVLASLGIKNVKVLKKPVISFFSTGDELVDINKKIKKGQIYDSNRYLLRGLLEKFPVTIKDAGVVIDNENKIINKFKKLTKESDLIITTGGVSVGDADYIKDALQKIGSINFWKISIKPGRPLAFGTIGSSYFFGLPGNPVSTSVTFDLFVKPAIYKILSQKKRTGIIIKASLVGSLRKKKGRVEYKRGILFKEKDKYYVKVSGLQGSNILSSLSIANCYIKLGMDTENLTESSIVDTMPFEVSHEK